MSRVVNGVVAATLMVSTFAQAGNVSGFLAQRDAMYVYNMNVTERVSKEFWGVDCDVFQVLFKMDSGSTSFRHVQSNSGSTANTLSARTWFPNPLYSYQSQFAYSLSDTAAYKVFGFESATLNGFSSTGRGTFFAYCFSTNPNARIFLWDGESCRVSYSNGTSANSVCM
jgi:hypothetical protein